MIPTRPALQRTVWPLLIALAACGGGNSSDAGAASAAPVAAPSASVPTPPPDTTVALLDEVAVATGETLDTHAVQVDGDGKLLSWVTPQDQAFSQVSALSWGLLLNRMPTDPGNGLKVYLTHSEYDPVSLAGTTWPNNPAGKNAMLAESAALYYAYSGNRAVIDLVRTLLDHQLAYGTTPAGYAWAGVPWSTGKAGSISYGNDTLREGAGVLEPDKVGELGFHGYLRMWQITGDTRYRAAAIACADALVKNLRSGNANRSPWPFRVNAQTGNSVEDYSSHVIAAIRLFDELIRLNLGNVAGYTSARAAVWNWLMTYPMSNNRWTQYFEDVPRKTNQFSNLNQYAPGQTARYLLEYPSRDADALLKASALIGFIESRFGGDASGDPGLFRGARTIAEQTDYFYKMASHTSRFGAINALLAAATGDAVARDKALRSLNWATYMARSNGTVNEGPAESRFNAPFWFTDGHGDYVRHFMIAMGAFPEWSPRSENHLLRSTSVITSIAYASNSITWDTFDADATEVLRVATLPRGVSVAGVELPQRTDLTAAGWTYDSASGVLKVRHGSGTRVQVLLDPALVPPSVGIFSPSRARSTPTTSEPAVQSPHG
jgi:hypothetical protein